MKRRSVEQKKKKNKTRNISPAMASSSVTCICIYVCTYVPTQLNCWLPHFHKPNKDRLKKNYLSRYALFGMINQQQQQQTFAFEKKKYFGLYYSEKKTNNISEFDETLNNTQKKKLDRTSWNSKMANTRFLYRKGFTRLRFYVPSYRYSIFFFKSLKYLRL